jgi:hypothetical protein
MVSLIGQSFGMQSIVHATMLEEAKYLLKTQLGIEKTFINIAAYIHCVVWDGVVQILRQSGVL